MKLRIAKGCIVIMPVIGTLGLFIFTFVGKIIYGWGLFVIMLLLSGIINQFFFRCPHCGKSIPLNTLSNPRSATTINNTIAVPTINARYPTVVYA